MNDTPGTVRSFTSASQFGNELFQLGPVEIWIVGVVVVALFALIAIGFRAWSRRLDDLSKSSSTMATQQAVMMQQLVTLSEQLADIPSLRRKVTELDVVLQRNVNDITELRGHLLKQARHAATADRT